jgi:hypothetical protein
VFRWLHTIIPRDWRSFEHQHEASYVSR